MANIKLGSRRRLRHSEYYHWCIQKFLKSKWNFELVCSHEMIFFWNVLHWICVSWGAKRDAASQLHSCVPTLSNRNLSWTYFTVYTDQIHRMSKGIFCMSKNLTEVIENIDKEERKEFWSVTLYKGKLAILMFTFFNTLFAISCYVLAQKSRW